MKYTQTFSFKSVVGDEVKISNEGKDGRLSLGINNYMTTSSTELDVEDIDTLIEMLNATKDIIQGKKE